MEALSNDPFDDAASPAPDDAPASRVFGQFRDPAQMQAMLAHHLRWADGGTVSVDACTVVSIRQAPKRLQAHYEVLVRDRASGGTREIVVTGIAPVPKKVMPAAADPAARPPPDVLAPAAYVLEHELLLQVFPFDYRLPALSALMLEPATLLAPHLLEHLPGDGEEGVSWAAEAVRYRATLRATVRVTATARGDERRFYAKVFRNASEAQRAYHAQEVAWEVSTRTRSAFTVARPAAWLPGERIVVLHEAAGAGLDSMLNSGANVEPAVRLAARALAGFHTLPWDDFPLDPRQRPARDEQDRIRRLGERLQRDLPECSPAVDRVMAGISAGLIDAPFGLTLFDIRPSHFLIDGGAVTLLDLDKIAVADPVVDVANVMAILDKEEERLRPDAPERRWSEIFHEEYSAHAPRSWQERLPAALALTLLAQASKIGSQMSQGGRQAEAGPVVSALLQKAEDVLPARDLSEQRHPHA